VSSYQRPAVNTGDYINKIIHSENGALLDTCAPIYLSDCCDRCCLLFLANQSELSAANYTCRCIGLFIFAKVAT